VCHCVECSNAECCYANCQYAVCHYVEYSHAECCYAKCQYEECHGASVGAGLGYPEVGNSRGKNHCCVCPRVELKWTMTGF
jgi:hypothetical protein